MHQESAGQNQDSSHLHELQALREEHVQDQYQHDTEERKREQEEHAAAAARATSKLVNSKIED